MTSRLLLGGTRLLAALVLVISVLATAHVTWAFLKPASGPDRVAAQVAWLRHSGVESAPRMQALFPEGAFFTHVLTGLAAASVGDRATVEQAWAATGEPALRGQFGHIEALDGGTFYRGWRLLLESERVRLTGTGRAELAAEATAVLGALLDTPTGVPASYPDGFWPCDAVVAMAAVLRARDIVGAPVPAVVTASWTTRLEALRDPATGLLAHKVTSDGVLVEGARGSSQAIIQTFWPDVDPAGAGDQWRLFTEDFVVREVGLIGVREHPVGTDSFGDVDSGPLVFGVSASASAVTLAAARRHGDVGLAEALDHEAEFLGLPLEVGGQRRFAFGVLPVGDAFVAWARGVPFGPTTSAATTLAPLWWGYAMVPGLVALVAAWALRGSIRSVRTQAPRGRSGA